MAKRILLIAVIVLLTGLSIYSFRTFFERWEKTVDLGWSHEARVNPFLAAEHYLARLGYSVRSDDNLDVLNELPSASVLLVSKAELVRSESRGQMLKEWLIQGGHLIIEAPQASSLERHTLLAPFAASRVRSEHAATKKQSQDKTLASDNPSRMVADKPVSISQDQLVTFVFADPSEKLVARFSPYFILMLEPQPENTAEADKFPLPFYSTGSAEGEHLMQFSVGEGTLTLLSDTGIWHSKKINQYDHAYLLYKLIGDSESGTPSIRILRGTRMPPLTELTWQAAPELVISSVVWLLAWLYYRSRRFGALREPEFTRRRALSEHIRAAADYLWLNKRQAALLKPLHHEIVKKAKPLLAMSQPSEAELHRALAKRVGLQEAEVSLAMSIQNNVNESSFVRQVILLQKIRESL